MDLLTYSSNDASPLNEARRQLWSSKYMLGMENKYPGEYAGKSFWMRKINEDRAELRKVAQELRARLPAKKLYRVPMISELTQKLSFVIFERAHSNGQAVVIAEMKYEGFKADMPEVINEPK